MIVQILNSLVSVRRIDAYLREEETRKYQQLLGDADSSHLVDAEEGSSMEDGANGSSAQARSSRTIGFEDASFTYVDDDSEIDDGAFSLRDINLRFPVGKTQHRSRSCRLRQDDTSVVAAR